MRIGVCHLPARGNLSSGYVRPDDYELLKPFDFYTPCGYLCPDRLIEKRSLTLDALQQLKGLTVHGHALVPCRFEHTPQLWGGYLGKGRYYLPATAELRQLKTNHLLDTLLAFPDIEEWTVTLETFNGAAIPRDRYWGNYYEIAKNSRPYKRYVMSEVLGTSLDRWLKIFDQIEALPSKPDELGIQIHARYPHDFTSEDDYTHANLLQAVIERSPIPVRLSEVCLWREDSHVAWSIATKFLDTLYHLARHYDVTSLTWWHWGNKQYWNLPGSPKGVPVVYRIEEGHCTYTPFGDHLRAIIDLP